MELTFDADQAHQLDAIESLVQLFAGQPKDADELVGPLRDRSDRRACVDGDVGAVGNNLVLDDSTILENLQAVQDKNGLEVVEALAGDSLDFDVEMETGTGKTYVYLRTIFELAQAYRFTKYVVLVPSVAVKEGVTTSIELMRQHLRDLYPAQPFDHSVYSGRSAEEVRGFATSTDVQILVMTIDSIRGAAGSRVIHQARDTLNGLRPIDYLRATHPIVIMDEPQNMESPLSRSSIGELAPTATLRFSATHRRERNVVYRLDPVDAHEHGLVKQIVVADVSQHGSDPGRYIKVVGVRRDPWEARLELAVRGADGSMSRRIVRTKQDQELSDLTDNPAYDGWSITALSIDPPYIELNRHGMLQQGEQIGAGSDSIYREMIRETIREHFDKQAVLAPMNVKVLSLFFVDKVESFLGSGVDNGDADGPFVQWFDELFREERATSQQWQALFPQDPADLRRGYFSVLKGTRGAADRFRDTSGTTRADDDVYDLIMRDKARLLDEGEPVRFVFSHSALREGWDNPNVFQICTLRETGAEVERRQTIGRGLRLPVDQTGVRVADRSIARLTVVANESYRAFATSLQTEYERSGVEIGRVRPQEFSRIPLLEEHTEPGGPEHLGYERSRTLYEALQAAGLIEDGRTTAAYRPTRLDFDLTQHIPDFFRPYADVIVERIARSGIERHVRPQSKRRGPTIDEEPLARSELDELWRAISGRTGYRVAVDRDRVVEATVRAVKDAPPIRPLCIQVTRAGVRIHRGGAEATERGQRSASIEGAYDLPDIVSELQAATSLTRTTIIDVLLGSGRMAELIANPHDFTQMVKGRLRTVLAEIVRDGVQYERVVGHLYELRELQQDGREERDQLLDQLLDRNVHDLEPRFVKLPSRFTIDTPVGACNPDWAILEREAGRDRIYLVRATTRQLAAREARARTYG